MVYGTSLESEDAFINLLKTRVYMLNLSELLYYIDSILCILSFQLICRDLSKYRDVFSFDIIEFLFRLVLQLICS